MVAATDSEIALTILQLAILGGLVVVTVVSVYICFHFAWIRKWTKRLAPTGLFVAMFAVFLLPGDPTSVCLKEVLSQPRDAYPLSGVSRWPPGEVDCAYRTGGKVVTITVGGGFWSYVAAAGGASVFAFALYGTLEILDTKRRAPRGRRRPRS